MLKAWVEAALGSHLLGTFEPIKDDGGYQARCSKCNGQSILVPSGYTTL